MFHPAVLRHAPWSVSKLGTLSCPRSFWHRYVKRDKGTASGSESKVGSVVHNVQEHGLLGSETSTEDRLIQESLKGELTGAEFDSAQSKMEGVEAYTKRIKAWEARRGVTVREVEGFFAMDRNFKACDYEDTNPDVLLRGKIDYMGITDSLIAVVHDHKTGKKKPVDDHATQLQFYMLLVLAKYPYLKGIECAIHYVGDPELQWMPLFTADDITKRLRPWLVGTLNRQATNLLRVEGGTAPAKVSPLCKWCSYSKDVCPEGMAEVARRAEADRVKAEAERAAKQPE